jgi:hypothetical protein
LDLGTSIDHPNNIGILIITKTFATLHGALIALAQVFHSERPIPPTLRSSTSGRGT